MNSSSISNAESPLLRLPQELKDRIYHLVYGGTVVCVELDPDRDSIQMHVFEDSYFGCRQSSVPKASLRICRQMYHDAKDAFYSTNEFRLIGRRPLGVFIQHLDYVSHCALAVQNMDIHVSARNRREERRCETRFCALVESLKNVRHISISIYVDEDFEYKFTRLESLPYRKEPFLPGLLEFKKLPLKTFTLVLDEHPEEIWEGGKEYLWTAVQKREWVQYMKGAVLGLD